MFEMVLMVVLACGGEACQVTYERVPKATCEEVKEKFEGLLYGGSRKVICAKL